MLRGTRSLLLLSASSCIVVGAGEARAVLIFDNFDPFASTGTYIGQHDVQGGDRMVVPSPGVGNMWVLNSFTGHMGASTAGTYSNVVATLTVYRTVITTGSGFAFANPFGSAVRNLGSFSAGGAGQGPDYTLSALNIAMHSPPTDPSLGYGVLVSFTASGPGWVVPHYRNQQSTVPGSSSSQGWYRDLNDDGTIGADEYEIFASWANGNLMFELDATAMPIPEPATALALLVPVGALAASRRRRRAASATR